MLHPQSPNRHVYLIFKIQSKYLHKTASHKIFNLLGTPKIFNQTTKTRRVRKIISIHTKFTPLIKFFPTTSTWLKTKTMHINLNREKHLNWRVCSSYMCETESITTTKSVKWVDWRHNMQEVFANFLCALKYHKFSRAMTYF